MCFVWEFYNNESCKIWTKDKAIKLTKVTATAHTKKRWIFLFGLISAYGNLFFCVYSLNNSWMESVIVILLRCECVSMGVPFFSQIHTLVPGGREPACFLAFLVLKDWNILPHSLLWTVPCVLYYRPELFRRALMFTEALCCMFSNATIFGTQSIQDIHDSFSKVEQHFS